MNRIGSALIAIWMTLMVPALLPAADDYQCGDFLKQIGKKPGNLEFRRCKPEEGFEDNLWVADYRVSGAHAAEVESFLVRNFGLKRLVKSCCEWDGPSTVYRKNGRGFEILMQSEEESPGTVSMNRAEWKKAKYFFVRVTLHKPKEFPK